MSVTVDLSHKLGLGLVDVAPESVAQRKMSIVRKISELHLGSVKFTEV